MRRIAYKHSYPATHITCTGIGLSAVFSAEVAQVRTRTL